MILVTAEEVERLLEPVALDRELRRALVALSEGRASVPPRVSAVTPTGRVTAMPGYLPDVALCLKAVSVCPQNAVRGDRPTHQAVILVFDESTGDLTALMDGTVITERRTAACAAIAADVLARPGARTLTIVGSGAQARAHLEAFGSVRDWSEVRVAARDQDKAAALATLRSGAVGTTDVRGAVESADVVCLCTDSSDPLIAWEWLAPGCHVGSVGRGREIDPATLAAGHVFVEWSGAATYAPPAGAQELQGFDPARLTELGAVIGGAAVGRRDEVEVTVYKSTGHAAEDAAAARVVVDAASRAGVGASVSW